MKVGDVVRVKDTYWREPGMIGIIILAVGTRGKGFKVLLANGEIRPRMRSQLEVINENR